MNAASAPMRTNSLFSSGSPWTEAPETVEPGDRGSGVRRGAGAGAADAAGAVDSAPDEVAAVSADVALSGADGCAAASATAWLPGRLRER